MGHISGKDIYRHLGNKLDNLTVRVPWNETLYALLKELYSPEEADIIVRMPFGPAKFEEIAEITKYDKLRLHNILDNLCSKGLVIDLLLRDEYFYIPSPMMVGIFEFTMMRTADETELKKWASMLYEYMHGDGLFFKTNFEKNNSVSLLRVFPHEDTIQSEHIEILDYEKATSIIEGANKFAIGVCSCRHEKLHLNKKDCDVPLDNCSSFGISADFLIRRNLAKEVSREEMLENLSRSKEMGLVLNGDNVRKNVTFMCHCCKCCCNTLLAINKSGYTSAVVTSNFIAEINEETCKACGVCVKKCPVNGIEMCQTESSERKKLPKIDKSICLGCGVCALKCRFKAIKLIKKEKRVIYPETTFERIILMALEKGTLQNQMFHNPMSISHSFMRAFVGAFLNLSPVKKALLGDMFRSSFLDFMKTGVRMQGKGWIMEI